MGEPGDERSIDGRAAAREAGLRYVSDAWPGIQRRRCGRGFSYRAPSGELVHGVLRERIESLAIPPAWRDVWICTDPRGHVQATGRDARGRKQYRYHPRWAAARSETKFHRLREFGQALPRLRRRVRRDLARPGLPRTKVVAALVRLLEATCARVGNERYRRSNGSYGLTTLRDRHAEVSRQHIRLRFRGKGGKDREYELHDPQIARIVRSCQDLAGQELFQYLDGAGGPHAIDSGDVNTYVAEATGEAFTAKDFRTWSATLHTLELLAAAPRAGAQDLEERILAAVDRTAERLGNTRSVCRESYLHPAVLVAFREARLKSAFAAARRAPRGELRVAERALVILLASRAAAAAA